MLALNKILPSLVNGLSIAILLIYLCFKIKNHPIIRNLAYLSFLILGYFIVTPHKPITSYEFFGGVILIAVGLLMLLSELGLAERTNWSEIERFEYLHPYGTKLIIGLALFGLYLVIFHPQLLCNCVTSVSIENVSNVD